MAALLPVAERIQHLRGALRSIQPPPDLFLSPETFPLDRLTLQNLQRLGPILSRFRRVADLIHRRSIRGSLPNWISALVGQSQSTASAGAAIDAPSVFRPSFKLSRQGLFLVDMEWRTDLIELAAWLQRVHGEMGATVVGGVHGILDGLNSTNIQGDRVLRRELATSKPSLETSLWLALLWSAPLQSVWIRELRASNLKFLREFVPRSWAVDPTPLPHQAVLPGLGLRSFMDLTQPVFGIGDLALRPASNSLARGGAVIRSQETPPVWAAALRQALQDFGGSPWVLQEHQEDERVEFSAWNPTLETALTIFGEVTLSPYYFEVAGRTSMGGILATIRSSPPIPERSKGETGETLSVLAPCGPGNPD